MALQYSIHYVVLPSRKIYNYLGPWDWRDDERRRQKRAWVYERKRDWYDMLEADILQTGIRNPIQIVSGKMPPNDWASLPEYAKKEGLVCTIVGGSRLFWAQKHDLDIPCIVSDFTDRFKDEPKLYQPWEIFQYFDDKPKDIKYSQWGLDLRSLPGGET